MGLSASVPYALLTDVLIGHLFTRQRAGALIGDMASPPLSPSGEENHDPAIQNGTKQEDVAMADSPNHPHSDTKTPEPRFDQTAPSSNTPSTPGILAPFDWHDFEARYEKALHDADEHEREILREAENLSKVWLSIQPWKARKN